LVSTGSSGEIYLGYYFGTPVAIKKFFHIEEEKRGHIEREYMLLKGIVHPNIVQFLGLCNHSTGIYLVTEYVEHGDLFDLLIFGEGKTLDWDIRVKIALEIAQACYYMHSKNVIHRDLKSQNVLLGENYKVKLCDLGLATVLETKKHMTMGVGTNEWMAPEIGLQETYDNKVDVFSFAIVMTEIIRCKPPAKRAIKEQIRFNEEGFLAEVPPGCPPDFAKLVLDCSKFSPSDRPPFKEIVPRLRQLSDSLKEKEEQPQEEATE